MVLWKSLDMSKTKIINTSTYEIEMMIRREKITATVAYETVKSTPSGMDDTYVHVLEYRSY